MTMMFTEADRDESKRKLRDRICDVFEEPEFLELGSVAISEVLIQSAFAWRDWNGGKDDTVHAAKVLRDLTSLIGKRASGWRRKCTRTGARSDDQRNQPVPSKVAKWRGRKHR
jgi:hypothetical protein